MWTLPDGTGLHAPYGQLVRDPDTGQVCCHLCGLWFRSWGSHLRRHGYTAADYREAMGLCRTRPMTSDDVSEAISLRQAAAYRRDPEVRSRLAEGQAMIRSGQGVTKARATDPESPAELVAVRREAQRRGRETRNRQRDEAVQARLSELGCADLGSYLAAEYASGASLADLGAATGLGTRRLHSATAARGITVRRPGDTTPAGRRSRALAAEREAAARVGTDDISTGQSPAETDATGSAAEKVEASVPVRDLRRLLGLARPQRAAFGRATAAAFLVSGLYLTAAVLLAQALGRMLSGQGLASAVPLIVAAVAVAGVRAVMLYLGDVAARDEVHPRTAASATGLT